MRAQALAEAGRCLDSFYAQFVALAPVMQEWRLDQLTASLPSKVRMAGTVAPSPAAGVVFLVAGVGGGGQVGGWTGAQPNYAGELIQLGIRK